MIEGKLGNEVKVVDKANDPIDGILHSVGGSSVFNGGSNKNDSYIYSQKSYFNLGLQRRDFEVVKIYKTYFNMSYNKFLSKCFDLTNIGDRYIVPISTDYCGVFDHESYEIIGLIDSNSLRESVDNSKETFPLLKVIPLDAVEDSLGISPEFLSRSECPAIWHPLVALAGIDCAKLDIETKARLVKVLFNKSSSDFFRLVFSASENCDSSEQLSNSIIFLSSFPNHEEGLKLLNTLKNKGNAGFYFIKMFVDIVSDAENITEQLENNFKTQYEKGMIRKIREKVAEQCSNIMSDLVPSIADCSKDEENDVYEQIYNSLLKVSGDLVFMTALKQFKTDGFDLQIEDFKNYELHELSTPMLIDSEVDEMCRIYRENITNVGKAESLISTFKERLNTPGSKLYLFKGKDGKIISFILFTKNEDGTTFASALNVDTDMRGIGIGEAVMNSTIKEESKVVKVRGEAVASKEVFIKYLSQDCIGRSVRDVSGDKNVSIEWYKDYSAYLGKTKKLEDLVAAGPNTGIEVKVLDSINDITIPEGKVLTRVFKNSENFYLIFEVEKGQ